LPRVVVPKKKKKNPNETTTNSTNITLDDSNANVNSVDSACVHDLATDTHRIVLFDVSCIRGLAAWTGKWNQFGLVCQLA
jgi:hypothetical protein